MIQQPQEISSSGSEIEDVHATFSAEQSILSINSSLQDIEESPIKLHSISSACKKKLWKKEIAEDTNNYKTKLRSS